LGYFIFTKCLGKVCAQQTFSSADYEYDIFMKVLEIVSLERRRLKESRTSVYMRVYEGYPQR
jgi:hypothetical protein